MLTMPPAKMARLKQAKEEAEKEVAEYRSHMEAAFQNKVAAVSTVTLSKIFTGSNSRGPVGVGENASLFLPG